MTTNYCTADDVRNVLSADGVTDRADDTPPQALGDVIEMASGEIDLWLLPAYTDANLAGNRWVKHSTASIAAYLLCERRGNPVPTGVAQKFERLLGPHGDGAGGRLDRIRRGQLHVPGLARRRNSVPHLSNMRVRLDGISGVRSVVERQRSGIRERPKDYVQHYDSLEFFDYGAGI